MGNYVKDKLLIDGGNGQYQLSMGLSIHISVSSKYFPARMSGYWGVSHEKKAF
jgi:hypothetical protein